MELIQRYQIDIMEVVAKWQVWQVQQLKTTLFGRAGVGSASE